MKAIRKPIGVTILMGMLFLAACALPFTNRAKAKELAQQYYYARQLKCGDSYYRPGSGTWEGVYFEEKGFVFDLRVDELTAADRANGVEWQGGADISCEMKRAYWPDHGWHPWTDCGTSQYICLRKQDGWWMYSTHNYCLNPHKLGYGPLPELPSASSAYPDFTCADVPKESDEGQ